MRNPALNIPSGDINSCSDNHLPASTSELPTANKLPFGNMGSVQAITYDPLTQRLFWVDGKSNRINSITLSGDDRQVVGEYTDVNAVTIDYDWTSDTLVWSEDYSTRISATTTDGRASGVIYEYPFSLSDVWLPTRLAVYPRNRYSMEHCTVHFIVYMYYCIYRNLLYFHQQKIHFLNFRFYKTIV